jgi:hypothetical protein
MVPRWPRLMSKKPPLPKQRHKKLHWLLKPNKLGRRNKRDLLLKRRRDFSKKKQLERRLSKLL